VLVHEVVGLDFESRRCTGLPLPRHVEPDMLTTATNPQEYLEFVLMVRKWKRMLGGSEWIGGWWRRVY